MKPLWHDPRDSPLGQLAGGVRLALLGRTVIRRPAPGLLLAAIAAYSPRMRPSRKGFALIQNARATQRPALVAGYMSNSRA